MLYFLIDLIWYWMKYCKLIDAEECRRRVFSTQEHQLYNTARGRAHARDVTWHQRHGGRGLWECGRCVCVQHVETLERLTVVSAKHEWPQTDVWARKVTSKWSVKVAEPQRERSRVPETHPSRRAPRTRRAKMADRDPTMRKNQQRNFATRQDSKLLTRNAVTWLTDYPMNLRGSTFRSRGGTKKREVPSFSRCVYARVCLSGHVLVSFRCSPDVAL